MLLKKILILCFLERVFGFLLDNNVASTGGTVPSNNQYLTVSEFYEEKKEQRHMTTELRHDTDQLRNDMEKTFALMTSQFKKQLETLQLNSCSHNQSSQNVNTLEQKYMDLEQHYRDLEANNSKLRNEFTDLLMKYKTQEQELKFLRIKTETKFASQENLTAEFGKEISDLKQLKNLQPLQDLIHIKQQLQSVASETHSLSVNERARSQDFLALYNKTVNIEETTNHRMGKYQNMTNLKFDKLENGQNIAYNIMNKRIKDLREHSETVENMTFVNLTKEVQNIQMNLNMSLAKLEQQINENSREVALTSCVSTGKTFNAGTLIKFDDVRTSIGIKNVSAFKTSGKFSCEVDGLYHISVNIACHTNPAHYSIFKNNNKIITIYDANAGNPQTSTGVVVVKMNVGDTISVVPDRNMYAYSSHWSCITIVMIQ